MRPSTSEKLVVVSLLAMLSAACRPIEPAMEDLEPPNLPDLGMTPDASRADLSTPPADLASGEYCPEAAGKMGAELLQTLTTCVSGHTSLSYAAARDAMFLMFSDAAMNYTIECLYTGRKAMMVKDRATAGANDFNTEHTWPQSLGATGEAMTDIHHLFPTDIMANSVRGNYPFGVVMTATWTGPDPDGNGPSKLGTSASGATVFEPRNPSKGNVARALFYFYTRYHLAKPTSYSTSNFKSEEAVLHTWHLQDPPDAAERAENEAIFQIQRNRNPYIDHPEYVDKIGTFPN